MANKSQIKKAMALIESHIKKLEAFDEHYHTLSAVADKVLAIINRRAIEELKTLIKEELNEAELNEAEFSYLSDGNFLMNDIPLDDILLDYISFINDECNLTGYALNDLNANYMSSIYTKYIPFFSMNMYEGCFPEELFDTYSDQEILDDDTVYELMESIIYTEDSKALELFTTCFYQDEDLRSLSKDMINYYGEYESMYNFLFVPDIDKLIKKERNSDRKRMLSNVQDTLQEYDSDTNFEAWKFKFRHEDSDYQLFLFWEGTDSYNNVSATTRKVSYIWHIVWLAFYMSLNKIGGINYAEL